MSLLSVIAPCRNERVHILAFCESVARQELPPGWSMEVLVADGQSDDGTRELLDGWCAQDKRFQRVDNPGRIVSTGLNRCIAQARGEVIARLDIHSEYASDYLAQCIAALRESGADNAGGPWRAEGRTPMQRAVAAAFQSRWVAGGARSRVLDYEGEVDTVYLGCWPRATFERVGGFDERLVRNQDDEHNLRIRRAGGRIWQNPRIRSTYFPRARLAQVLRQWAQYGYWKPFVIAKHGQPAALRHLVPAAFVLALGLGVVLAAVVSPWPLAALLLAYGALLVLALAGMDGLTPAYAARVVAVIAACHLGYGWGSLCGWWDVLHRREPRTAYGALTR
ncbi:glycosyltransferase family 2 protein [Alicycliphilus sp. T452]